LTCRGACGAAGAALLAAALAAPALAEPAIAVRTGYACSQCHVNRSGGGMRTSFGSLYGQLTMPSRLLRWREGGNLLPADPEARFAVGGDGRFAYVAVNAEEAEDVGSFEVNEANLYLEARLIPGRLSVYLDETVGPGGASARELFGLYSFRKHRAYVKAGKFLPPHGWRLPDDEAFIRQGTGFTYSAPDTGVEVGVEPGRWTAHLALTNGAAGGSDDDRSKKVTATAVRRFGKGRVGLSASDNVTGGVTSTVAGLFGGASFGRLALLAEGDWGEVKDGAGSTERLLAYFEVDVLLARGLNLKLSHDWIDPDRDVGTDARTRDTLALEYVPIPFVQLRWAARFRDGPPQVPGSRDDSVELELHLYF
jgi:hypothetical protein